MSTLLRKPDPTEPEIQRAPSNAEVPSLRHATSLSAHILPTSATMIGVCMTVLTIGHIGPAGEIRWIIDKLLALDALMFLASAVLSFISMRATTSRPSLELRAEWVFIVALALLVVAAVVLAFAIS